VAGQELITLQSWPQFFHCIIIPTENYLNLVEPLISDLQKK
jgi:hypothetical protein